MKIYIELIFILILCAMFLFWKLWKVRSLKKLLKNYKPENDKGRNGTELF